MNDLKIDIKDCDTVLEFLYTVIKALKIQTFYGSTLDVLGKTISSLENHGFTFPLTLKLVNVEQYKEKCPRGWEIFVRSLKKAQEEYKKKSLEFEYSFTD